MSTKQLYEKTSEGMKEVSPLVAIEDIYSKLSDTPLEALVSLYNHVKCEWKGSVADTRRTVPLFLRRSGLFITYNNGTKYITEFFSAGTDQINTENWIKDSNWTPVPDEDYISAGVKPGVRTIGYEQLNDNLKQLFREKVNVTNFPDDEDITSVDNMLKLKDREVNAANFQSKGYVILRKNLRLVNGVVKNILTQDMINKPNTIYEIRYDFDLNGKTVNVPENCILKFEGGSINGDSGVIIFNNTKLTGNIKTSVTLSGTIKNKSIYVDWNTNRDLSKIIGLISSNKNLIFGSGDYIANVPIELVSLENIKIDFNKAHIYDANHSWSDAVFRQASLIAIQNSKNIEICGGTISPISDKMYLYVNYYNDVVTSSFIFIGKATTSTHICENINIHDITFDTTNWQYTSENHYPVDTEHFDATKKSTIINDSILSCLGECNNIIIKNIVIKGDINKDCGINFEYGGVGSPEESYYGKHPHNVSITNVYAENAVRGNLIRTAGAFNINVENITTYNFPEALYCYTGDNGMARFNGSLTVKNIKCYFSEDYAGNPLSIFIWNKSLASEDGSLGVNLSNECNYSIKNVEIKNLGNKGTTNAIRIHNCQKSTILENIQIEGYNTGILATTEIGKEFDNVIKIYYCTFKNVNKPIDHSSYNNSIIFGCLFKNCSDTNILLNSSKRLKIENCMFVSENHGTYIAPDNYDSNTSTVKCVGNIFIGNTAVAISNDFASVISKSNTGNNVINNKKEGLIELTSTDYIPNVNKGKTLYYNGNSDYTIYGCEGRDLYYAGHLEFDSLECGDYIEIYNLSDYVITFRHLQYNPSEDDGAGRKKNIKCPKNKDYQLLPNCHCKLIRVNKESYYWLMLVDNNIVSGTTRPSGNIEIGQQFFDTTPSINKPIWWTGSKWVDATGADI